MKARSLVVVVALAFVVGFALNAAAEKPFGLEDIPEIKNKNPIHVALEAGGGSDLIYPFLEKFSEKTGIKVTKESHVFASLYSKEIVELQGRTGAYDLVVTETSWTNEWEDYLYPVEEMAQKFDPRGIEGLKADLKGHDPGLLRMCSTRGGKLLGLPYYTYTMITIYRADVLEDPTEKENFKKKYGYELAPVKTWDDVRNQAEFFTRKKGELLKGEPLKEDLYGVSLMAGRFPHVQDEIGSMLWSKQGRWASPVRDAGGELKGFKITDKDKELLTWAFKFYQDLMSFAPPGSENAFWDQATASFVAGKTVLVPIMYCPLWPWSTDAEKEIPGAKVATTTVPGVRPYTGAFHFAPSKDSKNPEAAYWLLRYITSYEAQAQMLETGWASVRTDVLTDPKWKDPKYNKPCGWIPPVLATWKAQAPDVNDYLHFNSAAFGKLYEEMTIICHENAIKKRTPEESTKEWVQKFGRIQRKFGQLPVEK
jgi:multiple sugar transport system substrate-binding protein